MTDFTKIPPHQRLITTHNAEGKAILSDKFNSEAPFNYVHGGDAGFSLGFITTEFPVNLNDDKDLESYDRFLADPPGLVKNNGTVLRVVVSKPS